MNQAMSIQMRALRRARPSSPPHVHYTCFLNWPVFALCGASWGLVVFLAHGVAAALGS